MQLDVTRYVGARAISDQSLVKVLGFGSAQGVPAALGETISGAAGTGVRHYSSWQSGSNVESGHH